MRDEVQEKIVVVRLQRSDVQFAWLLELLALSLSLVWLSNLEVDGSQSRTACATVSFRAGKRTSRRQLRCFVIDWIGGVVAHCISVSWFH